MKKIDVSTPTFPNTFAMVDDEDFESLNKVKWSVRKSKYTFYATRVVQNNRLKKTIMMHREIINPPKGINIDHKNRNGLCNLRSNLRIATTSQNTCNHKMRTDNCSGFVGVSWDREKSRWRATIKVDNKYLTLGRFETSADAAKARDAAAIIHYGEFATLNFPIGWEKMVIIWHEEKRKVSSLIPWARNPRVISKKQMEKLQASLIRFGYVAPVIVNLDNQLIAGHMRAKALILLGRGDEEIEVRMPNRLLTTEESRALAIIDNKSGGDWDMDILSADFEIPDLLDFGFEPFQLGIDDPNGPPAGQKEKKTPQTVIQYTIIFEAEQQQDRWHEFVGKLKLWFPDEETIAGRLDAFLRERVGQE